MEQYAPYRRVVAEAENAVVMIHGIVGTPMHFEFLLPVIPDSWSVYNLLLPGHGGSVNDFSRSSMAAWKHHVHDTLEEVLRTHKKVVLVAHSMGTLFAIREALGRREVAALFLLAVPLCPHLPPATALSSMKAALGFAKPGTVANEMLCDSGVRLSRNLFAYMGWIPRYLELFREVSHTKKLLPRMQTPAWVYQSRKDELVAFRAVNYLEHHPAIRLKILENSGHFAYRKDDPEFLRREFAQLLHMEGGNTDTRIFN